MRTDKKLVIVCWQVKGPLHIEEWGELHRADAEARFEELKAKTGMEVKLAPREELDELMRVFFKAQ